MVFRITTDEAAGEINDHLTLTIIIDERLAGHQLVNHKISNIFSYFKINQLIAFRIFTTYFK